MKLVISAIYLYLSVGMAFGQSSSIYNATAYGSWTSQVTGGNPSTGSSSLAAFVVAVPFNANASIAINRNGADQETLALTSVTNCFPNSVSCTLTGSFAFKHVAGETIQSGTYGLQEAINAAVAAGAGTVLIDSSWRGPAGSALITAATGSTAVVIQDNRSGNPVFYQWGGSAYAIAPQTVPTVTQGPGSLYFDDFIGTAAITLSGSGSPVGDSCAPTNTNASAAHPGVVRVISGTVSGSGAACVIVGAVNPGPFTVNGSNPWTAESELQIAVLPGTTPAAYQFGLASAFNASPFSGNYVGFYVSSANANANHFYCEYTGASPVDSGVSATVATWYRLSVQSDGTNLHWYLNGTQVCGTGVAVSNLTSVGVNASWTAISLTASTSFTMDADYFSWLQAIPTGLIPSATQR